MFSLGRRSSYRIIEDDEVKKKQGDINLSTINPPQNQHPNDHEEEEEEEDEHDAGRSMFESTPPNHHEIMVSFKAGDADPELQTKQSDDPAQWDHVKDVDQFFCYIYEYYQQKGFTCILFRYFFSLLRFAFVVLFSTFLLQCVDYDVLFYNRNTTSDGTLLPPKRRIHDAIIPQCYAHLNPVIILALFFATIFWIVHFIRICYRLIQFYEIKKFYSCQLQIMDNEMQNLIWPQIVQKLCMVQQRLHLIVNKQSITSLDVYQRILRHKNYFVALLYLDILPPQIAIPFIGSIRYLSTGLRFNVEWFLFWGPWSAWKGPYALKDEYKDPKMLLSISQKMQRTVAIMAITNLIFFPLIFIYQVLFSFFSYSEHFQRDPNVFGMRKYSNYGREKLRHFNEMDHELDARLNRSYEFAVRYTDQFISPLSKILARNICFMAAALFVVLCALTAYDEDTLKIEHVTTLISITGGIVLICRVFIPNEHMVYCQQSLMRQIVANIHYAPKTWLNNAHSLDVYGEFTQIFRLKVELLLEELLSPLFTPFILYFCIWKRIPEIITFLHENTVYVDGLGDVCSLAQMDIVKDGDFRLASLNHSIIENGKNGNNCKKKNVYGKVELSLLNFATQNPDWVPSKISAEFIQNVKEMISLEVSNAVNISERQIQQSNSFLDTNALGLLQASSHMPLRQSQGTTGLALKESMSKFEKNYANTVMNPPPMVGSCPAGSISKVPNRDFSISDALPDEQREKTGKTNINAYIMEASTSPSYLLTNSRLLASSFITPSPLAAIIQPQAVQESNLRATEMSLNALAVNHMLFLNNASERQRPRQNRINNRVGYGSILLGSLRRNQGSRTAFGMDSVAESNIWGVPAEGSLIQAPENQENDEPPTSLHEECGSLLC